MYEDVELYGFQGLKRNLVDKKFTICPLADPSHLVKFPVFPFPVNYLQFVATF